MKIFRMIGMSLFAVIWCVNFAACSDNDNNELEVNDANFLGKWYLSSEKGCHYNPDGTPTMNFSYSKNYPYHSDERIWNIIPKSDGIYKLEVYQEGYNNVHEIQSIRKNTFKKNNDLFVIKSLTDKEMVIEYIDHYFKFFDKSGILTNNNPDEIVDDLELIYYTFTR